MVTLRSQCILAPGSNLSFKLFAVALAFFLPSFGRANLQVFPTRVVLTDKQKTAQVAVRHHGKTAMRYRVSTVFYRMNMDGSMEPLKEPRPEDKSAHNLIRFSPRQVTLQPQVEQVIRLMFRKPSGLEEGEYRVHLHFEGIGQGDAGDAPAQDPGAGAQMLIRAQMAVAIPVIIRNGSPSATAKLSNLQLIKAPNQKPVFSVELERMGNANIFGDFRVFFIAKDQKPKLVGVINGVSSYIDKRVVSYPLSADEIGSGVLRVELRQPESEGGRVISKIARKIE